MSLGFARTDAAAKSASSRVAARKRFTSRRAWSTTGLIFFGPECSVNRVESARLFCVELGHFDCESVRAESGVPSAAADTAATARLPLLVAVMRFASLFSFLSRTFGSQGQGFLHPRVLGSRPDGCLYSSPLSWSLRTPRLAGAIFLPCMAASALLFIYFFVCLFGGCSSGP